MAPAQKAFSEATKVTAVDGEVVLDGPDGIGLSMTPDAAQETANRLHLGAEEARKQDTVDSLDEGDSSDVEAPDI